ncbi:MAG: hypothetical protein M3Y88_06035 [Chloroflexota bacterium]|nr:hypothetical protein [Chloroflexota bacterium]
MSEAERKRLDHVVLPRRRPGLALLERYFPSPADNILDAELAAAGVPGDTVLDPWAGTGWTARRAIAAGMRAVAADPSPFAQLAAIAFLTAPESSVLDAAFSQVASSRRVDVPLRQHLDELYATHCAACRRPVVGDQFVWPRGAEAPSRKVYRCAQCDAAVGGPVERFAPIDEIDLAKLGLDKRTAVPDPIPIVSAEAEEDLPPAPIGLTEMPVGGLDDPDAPLGEAGGPPTPPPRVADPPTALSASGPRYASTVRPDPAPAPPSSESNRVGLSYQQLHERFPVLDGRTELVDELLDLYTPRNLYALQAIANKIDAEIRDTAVAATLRLALAACLLPASRLNGYPGRVASLRITNGHVRQPASRHHREVNVWQLFERAYADVRTALAGLGRERRAARFATDFDDLGGVTAANVFWIRCRPAVVGQYLPTDSVDLVLGTPSAPATADELSFEYLATGWLIGREAAETLRLEPLFGGPSAHMDGAEMAAIRRGVASAASALKPGGSFSLVLEGDNPDWMLTVAVAAVAAGLELDDVVHRESRRAGDGVTLHFRKPSGEDRLRRAVDPQPLRLGSEEGHLTYPELAAAIEDAAVGLLRERGEPAGLARVAAALLVETGRSGLLRRVAELRGVGNDRPRTHTDDGRSLNGRPVLASLLREELWRDDHPSLVRLEDGHTPLWWLRNPELAESPLADRVEWATFSVLSTAGRLDEASFVDRIYALFPGLAAPDEELVRACLAAYARVDDRGVVRTEEALAERQADHARILGLLADYAHRLGVKAWIAKREHDRTTDGGRLGDRLRDDERRVYLPLVIRAPGDALGEVDAIWYVRGKLAFLFEVEWTAMVGESILRRGRAIPVSDQQARFLVIPAERSDLLRLKLERSPWLRAEMERQNWHVLKWPHLEALVARRGASLDRLEPILGLDPLIERGGEQLTMFGE